ncbi:hypothetical protein RGE_42810 [Rubrivivax gelatinosus IL144]|uniref:Uncharacterized protein n=1 Tax=Rubrivivax gelatinosus (strain NBRC 100245 / IL144) TaxID=983917 RepID=I0HX80_RUBGI|nr:hypothetical protein RGE_42810 [Rubrivivax gelatinosus IL144]
MRPPTGLVDAASGISAFDLFFHAPPSASWVRRSLLARHSVCKL